jgi:hypothetical protein
MSSGKPYWSLDLPGLTESQATDLLCVAEARHGIVGGSAIDPKAWLTLHVDRSTAETIAAALVRLSDDHIAESMGEVVATWLSETRQGNY